MDIEQILEMEDNQLRETLLILSQADDEESEEILEILIEIPELKERVRCVWEGLLKEKNKVVKQYRSENEKLHSNLAALTTDLSRLKNELEQSIRKLNLLEKRITETEQEFQTVNEELHLITNNEKGTLLTRRKEIETRKSQLDAELKRIKQGWNKKRSLILDIVSIIQEKGA